MKNYLAENIKNEVQEQERRKNQIEILKTDTKIGSFIISRYWNNGMNNCYFWLVTHIEYYKKGTIKSVDVVPAGIGCMPEPLTLIDISDGRLVKNCPLTKRGFVLESGYPRDEDTVANELYVEYEYESELI